MGGTSYSDKVYTSRIVSADADGTDLFTHSADIRSGRTSAKVHEKLDPAKKNKVGKLIRESFDSDEHPDSLPISIFFDVTGSMAGVPRQFVRKLGELMKLLVKKGYVKDPHLMFGAVGDATCDRVPLQVGQYESGNEMDDALSLIHLEGGGGRQQTESYELAMYYIAEHTDLDSLKKRGKKGYLFLMGDETPYENVKAHEVLEHIGDSLQEDIPTATILKKLRKKFEVFWIIPGGTNNYEDEHVNTYLNKMFGQNLLKLPNPDDVCELIASTIGLNEGYDLNDIKSDLIDVGSDKASVGRAIKAVTAYSKTLSVAKVASVKGSLVLDGKSSVERL